MLVLEKRKKTIIHKIVAFTMKAPALFFLFAAIIAFFVLLYVNKFKDPEGFNEHDVIVELHGVLFDLIVFGILLSIYEAIRSKNEKVERLKEELDDYRGWQEPEATYRVVGIIKRLNKLGINIDIDLKYCYLKNAPFIEPELFSANLEAANLQGARFLKGFLIGANFKGANLEDAVFLDTNLMGADFEGANLKSIVTSLATNFQLVNLKGANLEDVQMKHLNLLKVDLTGANLKGAYVGKGWFENLEKWEVIGIKQIKEKYEISDWGFVSEKTITNEQPN